MKRILLAACIICALSYCDTPREGTNGNNPNNTNNDTATRNNTGDTTARRSDTLRLQ